MQVKHQGSPSVEYRLEENGRFVVGNYNWARPFSNFLPGIGGPWGIPTWVFYVSRGQWVYSFCARSKDGAVLEVHPFNKGCSSSETSASAPSSRPLARRLCSEPEWRDGLEVERRLVGHRHFGVVVRCK